MLDFQKKGSEVFDNGNLIRTQATRGRRRQRLRHSDLHRGLSAAALCPRHRPLPLDGAVGRGERHRPHRRSAARDVPRQQDHHQLDPAGARACALRGTAGAHRLARARRAHGACPPRQRTGRKRRAEGTGRLLARPSRCRGDGASKHHDRADEGWLRRDCRLAADRCDDALLLDGGSRRRSIPAAAAMPAT